MLLVSQHESIEVRLVFLTMLVFTRGERLSVCPVHANRAFLCVTIQSSLPSRCTMTMEVIADFVAIRAV